MTSSPVVSQAATRPGWRNRAILALLLAVLLWAPPKSAGAHAYLVESDPGQGTIVAAAPAAVHLRFAEPLEPLYTDARLFDARGEAIQTGPATIGPQDFELMLSLPPNLSNGTYTVAWRNISAADGHPAEGLLSFTIGSEADIVTPEAPSGIVEFGGPPTIVQALGRWLTFAGLAVTLGTLTTWIWVIRPAALVLDPPNRDSLSRRAWRLAACGAGIALAGSVWNLVTQTLVVESSLTTDAVTTLLGETTFGRAWIVRVLLLALLAAGLLLARAGRSNPRLWRDILLTLLAAAPLAPIAWTSHAAALDTGRPAAILADLAHLIAGGIWAGGLLALFVLLARLHGLTTGHRALLYTFAIPRFSTLAISSVAVLALTGIYAGWLQVGSWNALRDSDYGRTLTVKVSLAGLMLALGAVNLLLLEPRLRRAASSGMHIRKTVAVEACLGVAVLLLAGLLTSLPTARGELEQASSGRVVHLSSAGIDGHLTVSPGVAGVNRYTLDLGLSEAGLPAGSVVLMRVISAGEIAGIQEVELAQTDASRFEATGSEFSVAQTWEVEMILRRPGQNDWMAGAELDVPESAGERPGAPDPAPRFAGLAGALFAGTLLSTVPLLVLGWRSGRSKPLLATAAVIAILSLAGLTGAYRAIDSAADASTDHHDHHDHHP